MRDGIIDRAFTMAFHGLELGGLHSSRYPVLRFAVRISYESSGDENDIL
jgi:hypothetical protein